MIEVMSGEITVSYSIYKQEIDGDVGYTWVVSNGSESYEWFDTAREAMADVLRNFG